MKQCMQSKKSLLWLPVLLSVLSGCASPPARVTMVRESRYADVDETCRALRKAIEAEGMKCLTVRNTTKSVHDGGLEFDRQVRVVEWCKAEYARDMLVGTPEISALLPCTFGVYEGDDGKVYISAIDMERMGRMYGGTVAAVMGEKVSRNQATILDSQAR